MTHFRLTAINHNRVGRWDACLDDSGLMAKQKTVNSSASLNSITAGAWLQLSHEQHYRSNLRGQLAVLSEPVELRQRVFEAYRRGLSDLTGIEFMPEPPWSFRRVG